jgi:hypothetical protein
VPSSFAWLDTSERDRQRALDVIDLFQQKETVDELGLGSVRDTIADLLAPGTSTIQTRARYFFFIAWIYQDLERTRGTGRGLAAEARKAEIRVMGALKESADNEGTIGFRAGPSLQRLPSTVYWAGLKRLSFRVFAGGLAQYHRSLERKGRLAAHDESGDLSIDVGQVTGNWSPHIPKPPSDFPSVCSFELTSAESKFFTEQLRLHARDSLLQYLVERGEPMTGLDAPWERSDINEMADTTQQWINDGQCFSELMYGVQLIYNLMLSEARAKTEWIERYRDELSAWAKQTDDRMSAYRSWRRPEFWSRLRSDNSRLPSGVERFCENWFQQVLTCSNANGLMNSQSVRELVKAREYQLKHDRARLFSRPHLDAWGGASGVSPLTYRWSITEAMVNDIVAGLKRR